MPIKITHDLNSKKINEQMQEFRIPREIATTAIPALSHDNYPIMTHANLFTNFSFP